MTTSEALSRLPVDLSAGQRAREEAQRRVAAVRDDPEGRYHLRRGFYDRFGFQLLPPGFGASELAFLRWEIERGVLNPESHARPGSPWWRAVNESLLVAAEEASLLFDEGARIATSQSSLRWLEYLLDPSEVTWYRAHNTSVIRGYVEHVELARQEPAEEQQFLNMVLYRVIFAGAMVEARTARRDLVSRIWDDIQHIVANPELPAVQVLVMIPDFYPRAYPAALADGARQSFELVDFPGRLAIELFDGALILPHASQTYRAAAAALEIRELETFLEAGKPVYPPAPATPTTP